ncbi:helix-turn-helix transcriptional regulator [Garicola koreensis]|uniref:Putative DNA-binding transcriptional regulator YafY n=1 Tax=Garicola koreensis TaxID=1262554 RepID=A0A7W5TV01_9MICC|nr:WYL domain-containing protein [Garicola koreensis]MBB3667009.1 putative DNA-binding transcriptional regulator YafY [Garicola koreensis]
MAQQGEQTVQADPMLVRCLTLHQSVLEHSPHGLTKEQIYQQVDGYAGRYREAQFLDQASRERELSALERRFSSDKQYLRSAGIPIQESEDLTGDHRYRIPTEEYGLPDLQLSQQERLALHQARMLFSASSVRGLQHAMWALSGTAENPAAAEDPGAPTVLQASLGSATELDRLLEISLIGLRTPITFTYTGRGPSSTQRRRAVPLALGGRGHWYLIGHDLDRRAQRIFRLDRIQDAVVELKTKDLGSAERDEVEQQANAPDFDAGQTQTILRRMAEYQEPREALQAVIDAHSGQAPEPGRLRPVGAEVRKDNIGLSTDRVINMTAYLLDNEGVPPSRLLSEYHITAEQLHRDLLSIEQSGPNVGMSRYVSVEPELPLDRASFDEHYLGADEPIILTVPDGTSAAAMHRPVSLTKPGALSLLIALKALIEVSPAQHQHLTDAAHSVQQKVMGVVPESIASAAEAMTLQRTDADSEALGVIEAAITGDYALQLHYTDAAGGSSHRSVEPVHVIYDGPHIYLRAWCRSAAGERLFRFDRFQSLTPLPDSARSAEAHALERTEAGPAAVQKTSDSLTGVVLRFAPFAAAAPRFAPELQRRDSRDGSVFIRTHFASRRTAITICLEAGGDIELVHPEDLRHQVLRAAEERLSDLDSQSR